MDKDNTSRRELAIDAKLKAMFDAKAAEPAPERLVDLARELDQPPVSKAS